MGAVRELGTRDAAFIRARRRQTPAFPRRSTELLADHDDALLAAYVDDRGRSRTAGCAANSRRRPDGRLCTRSYFGSAITGAGVDALLAGITRVAAGRRGRRRRPGVGHRLQGRARSGRGEDRLRAHVLRHVAGARSRAVRPGRRGKGHRDQRLRPRPGRSAGPRSPRAEIGKLWGLGDVRIARRARRSRARPATQGHFAPPTLETVVVPDVPARAEGALAQCARPTRRAGPADQPAAGRRSGRRFPSRCTARCRRRSSRRRWRTSSALDVTFRETTTICIERPSGTGAAVEVIARAPNPFLATVGLRIEPAAVGTGVQFRLGVELGSMPHAFFKAVEETVHETLRQGLYGWQVTTAWSP